MANVITGPLSPRESPAEVVKRVDEYAARCRALTDRPSAVLNDVINGQIDLFEPNLTSFAGLHEDLQGRPRATMLAFDMQLGRLDLSTLPGLSAPLAASLTLMNDRWTAARASVDAIRPEARKIAEAGEQYVTARRDAYMEFIDAHRLSSTASPDPHPPNVRVIATTTQQGLSFGNWQTSKFTDALTQTATMDAAIGQFERQIFCQSTYGDLYVGKPVSTPVSAPDAWRKQDNGDDTVRRVLVVIAADNGDGKPADHGDILDRGFVVESPEAYRARPDDTRYRVDRVIVVQPPSNEEAAAGITMEQRIRDAFAEAGKFADAEVGRKHEGMAVWLGHGKANGQPSDMQGSMDYLYLTRFGRASSGIEESEIKRLERAHLANYRYFVQFISTCSSGAAIS